MNDPLAKFPTSVTAAVPARLHLGFLDLNGSLGRTFGSIGLAIDGARTRVTIRTAQHMRVSGPESERAGRYLETMQRALGLATAHDLTVEEAVPAHAGLGSGTQIALAVAASLRRLHDLPLDVEGDAVLLGRGARSGVGIGLFDRGGLVVDGGRGPSTRVAPIIAHLPFPDAWRIVVVLDRARQGVHGPDESAAFAALAPMSDADAGQLCRLVVMNVLPALAEADIASFGAAVTEIQARVGDYFAPVQGGRRFISPDVAAVLAALGGHGALGIGQSSWGPTGFAFAASAGDANRLAAMARQHPSGRGLDIRVCKGLNHGAETTTQAAAGASPP